MQPYNLRKSIHNSPSKLQGSPIKGSVLLHQDCLEYAQSLNSRKQSLTTSLELYKLSYDNQIPQKCFPHNNFITLYCEDQKILLCVNCIYGSTAHKTHRVVPSNDTKSKENIARDNQTNIQILESQLDRIKVAQQEIFKNQKILAEEYKRVISTLDKQFNQMIRILQIKRQQMKERAMDAFSRATNINIVGKDQVRWWKQYLANLRHTLPKHSQKNYQKHSQTEIYKHLVLTVLNKEKLDLQKLNYIPSPQQITDEFVAVAVRLRQTIQEKLELANPIKTKMDKIKYF